MLTITPKAAEKIKELVCRHNVPEGFLRLRILAGGCGGLSYTFDVAGKADPGDMIVQAHGARLAIDGMAVFYLNGAVLDYTQSLMKSGFELKNPNAASTCSCGSSFSV